MQNNRKKAKGRDGGILEIIRNGGSRSDSGRALEKNFLYLSDFIILCHHRGLAPSHTTVTKTEENGKSVRKGFIKTPITFSFELLPCGWLGLWVRMCSWVPLLMSTVNPLTKIILFLHGNSTDTQVRPARANQHLRNTHKTAPKNETRIPKRPIERLSPSRVEVT